MNKKIGYIGRTLKVIVVLVHIKIAMYNNVKVNR